VVDGTQVAEVELADTYLRRLRGMLWRQELPAGLLLLPGGSVHGVGMTRSLDVALLVPADESSRGSRDAIGTHRVVRTALLRPLGLVTSARGVRSVLEAPVGSFAGWGLATGSTVEFQPVSAVVSNGQ
jgi:uncharacterized membrane protein (UPF0127 family)